MNCLENSALVTAVQHFCLHDGPGTRSVVFFKGCPLRCVWCQNPETWSRKPEHFFKRDRCLGCESCVEACLTGSVIAPGRRDDNCALCFDCAAACPSGALTRVGIPYTVTALLDELRPEFPFLKGSSGGVTFSGGEPTIAAPRFATELAGRLRDEGLHVALETCGHFTRGESEGAVGELLSRVDLVLFDIKLFDQEEHRRFCGTGNDRIKRNLELLTERAGQGEGPVVWPRLPLIPGATDSPDNLRAWAAFLKGLRLGSLTLVPYHRMGESKREWLGLPAGSDFAALPDESIHAARAVLESEGVACFTPGEEDFTRLGS